jgi:TonB family protein
MIFRPLLLLLLYASVFFFGAAQTPRLLKIAVLDESSNSPKFTEQFIQNLNQNNFKLIDQDLARAAATGAKLDNPFNLSVEDARNLGAIIDCDFFFVVKSDTAQRSSFQKETYFESYGIVFLVNAQTGRLVTWTDKHFEADTPVAAEKMLLAETKRLAAEYASKVNQAAERERLIRAAESSTNAVLIENLPDEAIAAEQNFRVPLPYKRLTPEYPQAARQRSVEATVDVAAELNERGEVERTEIVRWAGFDLDEAAADAVRKMQFRPALRDGKPIAIRVLLRYNFRDLQKQ